MCPRGGIGRHKGLKILAACGVPVRVRPRAPKLKMVKQITALEFKELPFKQGCYLIDVRTPEEWKTTGKPDGEAFGLSTYFVTYQLQKNDTISLNPKFLFEMDELNLDKNKKIFFICASGIRSQIVADIFEKKGFETYNISDGFLRSSKVYASSWLADKLPIK